MMRHSRQQRQRWKHGYSVEQAKKIAQDDMGVEFIYPDINLFKDKVSNVQQEMLDANPDIQNLYDHIQMYNEKYANTIRFI